LDLCVFKKRKTNLGFWYHQYALVFLAGGHFQVQNLIWNFAGENFFKFHLWLKTGFTDTTLSSASWIDAMDHICEL
jgi:hypothetical protein